MLEFKLLVTAYAETHMVNMEKYLILNAPFLALDKTLKNAALDGETLFTVLVTWVGNFLFWVLEDVIEFLQYYPFADAFVVPVFKSKVKLLS